MRMDSVITYYDWLTILMSLYGPLEVSFILKNPIICEMFESIMHFKMLTCFFFIYFKNFEKQSLDVLGVSELLGRFVYH